MSWSEYLFSFSGRINRAKLWLFIAIMIGVYLAMVILFVSLIGTAAFLPGSKAPSSQVFAGGMALVLLLVFFVVIVVAFIASLSLSLRRLHDRNKSGLWLLLFWLAPAVLNVIGTVSSFQSIREPAAGPNPIDALFTLIAFGISVWAFVELYCLRGTIGENQYGLDPLDPSGQARVFE